MARETLDPYEAMEAVVRHRLHVDLAPNSVSVWYRDADNRMRSVDQALGADAMLAVCDAVTQAAELAEQAQNEPSICTACNGSCEGMYDGTRCRSCGGSGTERTERDEPDWDALRKDRMERELMGES